MRPSEDVPPAATGGPVASRIGGLAVRQYPARTPADVGDRAVGAAPLVVLVHGSLDRADSFRRVVRRLPWAHVVTYDRRGYHGSREAGPLTGLHGHVDDLVALLRELVPHHRPALLAGHSLGGDVVLGAALTAPALVAAAVAFEPPLPWLGFARPRPPHPPAAAPPGGTGARDPWGDDPALAAERFFGRMVGAGSWARLSEHEREERRLDGAALVGELRSLRAGAPFDVTRLDVPLVVARGGPASAPHHRDGVGWLADHVSGAVLVEVPGASHGAHLSHPDAFAGLIERAAVMAGEPWSPARHGADGGRDTQTAEAAD